MTAPTKPPLGVRRNNPGNLRTSDTKWLGKTTEPDAPYESFETPEHGIRALARCLKTYFHKRHLKSVGAIISRYAPASENDTLAYVKHVSKLLGVKPDEPIDLDSELTLTAMVAAIIRHECGKRPDGKDWYEPETLIKGVEMAVEA